ncbi:MAG: FAD binding domain-containing protein [Chloroflexota bacterium]
MTVTDYYLPASLPEALGLLDRHGPELLVMAGGTVAMPLINEGISLPGRVMGLRKAGLDGISRTPDGVRIGATTTLTTLAEQDAIPLLAEAAARTASWSVRNMGTVGGNLFTPPPGGDIAVALLALDATVVVASLRGERSIAVADFFTGFMTTGLALDEIVTAIVVPTGAGAGVFAKLGRKAANTPAVVTVAVRAGADGERLRDVRIALGAVGPYPMRACEAETVLEGRTPDADAIARAVAAAVAACEPFSDAVASDWYRRRMTGVITGRALEQLASRIGRGA